MAWFNNFVEEHEKNNSRKSHCIWLHLYMSTSILTHFRYHEVHVFLFKKIQQTAHKPETKSK